MHYFSGKGCSEFLESMHYCIGILNQMHIMTTVNYLHRKTDMRLTIVVKKYIGFNSSYMVTSIEYKKFSRETIADYKQ